MFKKFYELDIWKTGYKLLDKVYIITVNYPSEEKFGLISDTRRAANSIIANIAESHGRYYFKDKIRVLYIARGEISEVQSHLIVAYNLGHLEKQEFQFLIKEYEGLKIGLSKYIQSLAKQNTD